MNSSVACLRYLRCIEILLVLLTLDEGRMSQSNRSRNLNPAREGSANPPLSGGTKNACGLNGLVQGKLW